MLMGENVILQMTALKYKMYQYLSENDQLFAHVSPQTTTSVVFRLFQNRHGQRSVGQRGAVASNTDRLPTSGHKVWAVNLNFYHHS